MWRKSGEQYYLEWGKKCVKIFNESKKNGAVLFGYELIALPWIVLVTLCAFKHPAFLYVTPSTFAFPWLLYWSCSCECHPLPAFLNSFSMSPLNQSINWTSFLPFPSFLTMLAKSYPYILPCFINCYASPDQLLSYMMEGMISILFCLILNALYKYEMLSFCLLYWLVDILIQQMVFKELLFAKHYSKHWRRRSEPN